jgi:DNA modification methylase
MTPTFDNGVVQLYQGDARQVLRELPAESVHCVVTSPPYWGLRDYGLEPLVWGGDVGHEHDWGEPVLGRSRSGSLNGSTLDGAPPGQERRPEWSSAFCPCGTWRGSLGLELTIDLYVQHIVEVFREVWRVLRKDGTLWLNMGDSYSAASTHQGAKTGIGATLGQRATREDTRRFNDGLKPKDLCMMPARVALALQADGAASPETMRAVERVESALLADYDSWAEVPDRTRATVEALRREWADAQRGGWWLRSDIVWSKPNPMPESVTDRPTRSHEYLFLLTKAARYYYDIEAIKEPSTEPRRAGQNSYANVDHDVRHGTRKQDALEKRTYSGFNDRYDFANPPAGRNKRSVWEIATEAYPEAHFATFPQKLVEPCILAGTSEHGVCPQCGAPWERVVERVDTGQRQKMADGWDTGSGGHGTIHRDGRESGESGKAVMGITTTGWHPTCGYVHDNTIPGIVLDPFAGSGTVAYVAQRLGRRAIGIDLSMEYLALAEKRMRGETLPMI